VNTKTYNEKNYNTDINKNNDSDTDKALRIMEAFSAVDEELLYRTEQKNKHGKITYINSRLTKATRYLAACAVLAVIGIGSFAVFNLNTSKSSDSSGSTDNIAQIAAAVTENAETASDAGVQSPQPMMQESENGESAATKVDAATTGDAVTTEAAATTEDAAASLQDSRVEVSLDAAKSTERTGAHIPDELPEGYTLISCRSIPEGSSYNDIYLKWSNASDTITVEISDYYMVYDDLDLIYGSSVSIGNISIEDVESRCTYNNGKTDFTIDRKFDDGVYATVTINADITPEEILAILKSM
jgi:hypothetical protein